MHDLIIVGVPLLAIFAGILFNRQDTKEIRGEISSLRTELKAEVRELRGEINRRFDAVDVELRYFHGFTGKLDARVESLEKRG